jgi:hypothetical protein
MTKVVVTFMRINPNAGLPILHGKLKINGIGMGGKDLEAFAPITIQWGNPIEPGLLSPILTIPQDKIITQRIDDIGKGILLMWSTTDPKRILPHPIILCFEIPKNGEYSFNMGINWYGV